MAKSTRKRPLDDDYEAPRFAPPTSKPRGSRWKLKLVMFFGLLLVAALAATPTVLLETPMRERLLSAVSASMHGTVTVDEVAFGWITPLEMKNVAIHDEHGKLVLSAPRVIGDKALLGLVGWPLHFGRVQVDQPRVEVELREGGSNVEDMLANFLSGPSHPSSLTVGGTIEVADALVVVSDLPAQKRWEVRQLSGNVIIPNDDRSIECAAEGSVVDNSGASPFSCRLQSDRFGIKTQNFPLALVQSMARRSVPGTLLDGRLQADLTCQWQTQNNKLRRTLDGRFGLEKFAVAGNWSGGEPFRLAALGIPCHVVWEGDQLSIDQFELACDVGKITCQGTIGDPLKLLDSCSPSAIASVVGGGNAQITGQIDLAKLAQLLPNTLHIRSGGQITSGALNMQLTSQTNGPGAVWQGRVEASRIVANLEGRELAWDSPLSITFLGRHDDKGISVDRLACQSVFMQLTGSGTTDAAQLNGTLDLGRLSTEAGKIINLDDVRLAGQGNMNATWKRQDDGAFHAGAQMQLAQFEFSAIGGKPWTEAQLTLTAAADGVMNADRTLKQVDAAQCAVVAADDQLVAKLRQGLNNIETSTAWPIEIEMQGQAARWFKRLSWLGLPAVDVDGQTQWSTFATFNDKGVAIERSDLVMQPMRVHGSGLFIDEPAGRMHFVGNWKSEASQLEVGELDVETQAIALQARDTILGSSPSQPMRGTIAFNGDMTRLQRWVSDPAQPLTAQLRGALSGRATIADDSGRPSASIDASIANFVIATASAPPWTEPAIRLVGNAEYDRVSDQATIQSVSLASQAVQVQAKGHIGDAKSRRVAQIDGQLNYDLSKLQQMLQPYIGNGVQIVGRHSKAFSFSAPLIAPTGVAAAAVTDTWLQQFAGRADFGWDAINIHGVPVGPGGFQSELRNGVATTSPINLAVGSGKLLISPQMRVSPQPMEMQIVPGQVLDHVAITPAMCNQNLRFIAPAFAGVLKAQGSLSLYVDGCRVPMSNPKMADAVGHVTIHSLEVTAGPFLNEIGSLFNHGDVARVRENTEISFRMVQGRIYHDGLELQMPGFAIRTKGSVGTDETLSMLVEMPMPTQALGNVPGMQSMQGQTIQVPIGGTITHPQVDRTELARLSSQLIRQSTQGAAESAIRNGLNNGLNGLLGPAPGARK